MKSFCYLVRLAAPSVGDGELSERLERHVGQCLRCQAEVAKYGRLRRQLAALSDDVVTAPKPLTAAVAAAIAGGVGPSVTPVAGSAGRIIAAASAVTAATAGAVAIALWRHSRPAIR